MAVSLSAVTYLVGDYDEAIAWFTVRLGFHLLQDEDLGSGKRWVRVAPSTSGTCLLLARATGPEQMAAISRAAGGRVAYFLYTDDFAADHDRMLRAGITFREAPRQEPYGTVAVFEDLYGNGWDLIEPKRRD